MKSDIEKILRDFYNANEMDEKLNEEENRKDKLIKDYENQIKTFQQNYKQLEERCKNLEFKLNLKNFVEPENNVSNVQALNDLLKKEIEEMKKDLIEKENLLKSRNDAYNKIYEENEKLKNQYKTERTVQQICLDIEKKIDKVTNSIEKTYPARPYPWQKAYYTASPYSLQKELDPEDSWWKGKADHTIVSNTTDV